MADAMYTDPSGTLRRGKTILLQKVGEQADGKIHFVAGADQMKFNIEDGDEFFTAVFAVDPFDE